MRTQREEHTVLPLWGRSRQKMVLSSRQGSTGKTATKQWVYTKLYT